MRTSLKLPRWLAPALVLVILAVGATPALAAAPEAPVTEPVTANTGTSVTFNGTLNPGVAPQGGTYEFRYKKVVNGAGCEGESATPAGIMSGLPTQPVTEPTAVDPDTEYTVCLAATNMEPTPETTVGNSIIFTTKALPPEIISESAPAPKATEATLDALINPNNQSTTYTFEYATNATFTENFSSKAGAAPLTGYNSAGEPASVALTGLTSQKVYYYRVVAENAKGEQATPGNVQSFLTGPPETPVEAKVKADSTTATSVEVEGVLNPVNAGEPGSTYEFIYNETSSGGCAGGKAAPEPAGVAQGLTKEHVFQKIEGLKSNVEYTFCLIATNAAGEKTSATAEPVTFSTRAAAPVISGESATNVTQTAATIVAKVNPEGLETHAYVEYDKGQDTAPVDIGAVVGEHEVSFALKGLTAGTTYPFHVVAFNSVEPVNGPGGSFKTLAPPPAHGETPWWGLTTSVAPTYLHSGAGKDEVQEIIVGPHLAVQLEVNGTEVGLFESEPYPFGAVPHATAANIQAALESPSAYGPGNVVVTGQGVTGQGPEGLPPLTVTTVNQDAERPVPPVVVGFKLGVSAAEAKVVTQPQGDGKITVFAENLGDSEVNGASGAGGVPIDFADKLPPGMEVTAIEGHTNQKTIVPLSCSPETVSCTFTGTLPPYESIEIVISVKVNEGAVSGKDNEVTVAGGGAPSASARQPLTVSDEPVPFGVESYGAALEGEGGAGGGGLDTQAGSHPFQFTTTIAFNQTADPRKPPGLAKDLHFDLPPGLVGNPAPFPQCTDLEFTTFGPGGNQCPPDTVMGVASVTINTGNVGTFVVPVFNLTPNSGEPARFGFEAEGSPVILDTSVRTGGDYGVTVSVDNITQRALFLSSRVTFWGVPGASTHDASRGSECVAGGRDREEQTPPCTPLGQVHPPPFLTLPTSCTGPLQTTVAADSWAAPGSFLAPLAPDEPLQSLDGCNRLQFSPEIKVAPDLQAASTPSGLTVDVHVPQEGQLNPNGLAQSALRDTTVTLPAGVAVNPAGADGLEACAEGLVGYLPGESTPPEELHFTPKLPGSFGTQGSEATLQPGINFCPDGSKVGTVNIKTPLLPNELTGSVYLADQNANPFGSLVAMYAVAEDPVSGVLVKLPFNVSLDPSSGQLVASSDSPEVPFETAEFHFFGGERAPLSTPAHCGSYTTTASFAPWSQPPGGTPSSAPVSSQSSFEITSGPNHGPCPGASLPFHPTLTGGATNLQAGAFSPFTATMSRKDGEQNMQSLEVHLPPGLSGILTGVELCPEPQANLGECGPNSLIGETTVSVGVGGDPFSVSGGKFYLTGPYNGSGACTVGTQGCAPFGITFEVPAKAGPFDLKRNSANPAGENACDCVLVRGKIEIDPHTAAITITSNPPGTPDAIPTSIEGIPLEIQHVNAITTRGNFQFNPTNCSKMEVTGTIHSSVGGLDTIGVPFQVTNCAALKFGPKLSVSTSGKTSKAKGASLTTKVTYPKVPQGADADIAKVKVDLPKQLPSRLTTLQKACTAKQFEADPAGCPAESKIGYAVVHTPILPVPLVGPAIFVSHGGEAFPSLTMVLQGDGVTIELVGTTFISKAGITSSTFKTVPDQPFSSFELTLPQGKFSALAANGKLCAPTATKTVKKKVTVRVKGRKKTVRRKVKETVAATLQMPTAFVAQNGAEIHETTPIGVTGCPKKVKAKVKKVKRRAKKA